MSFHLKFKIDDVMIIGSYAKQICLFMSYMNMIWWPGCREALGKG